MNEKQSEKHLTGIEGDKSQEDSLEIRGITDIKKQALVGAAFRRPVFLLKNSSFFVKFY